jgi:hypothetical protein
VIEIAFSKHVEKVVLVCVRITPSISRGFAVAKRREIRRLDALVGPINPSEAIKGVLKNPRNALADWKLGSDAASHLRFDRDAVLNGHSTRQ